MAADAKSVTPVSIAESSGVDVKHVPAPAQSTAVAAAVAAAAPAAYDIPKDFECCLCLRLFLNPVRTPCNHVFCLECIIDSNVYKPICPLCRGDLLKWKPTVDTVDTKLQQQIKNEVPAGVWRARAGDDAAVNKLYRMRFVLGNEHQLIPSTLKAGSTHLWTVFLRARPEDAAPKPKPKPKPAPTAAAVAGAAVAPVASSAGAGAAAAAAAGAIAVTVSAAADQKSVAAVKPAGGASAVKKAASKAAPAKAKRRVPALEDLIEKVEFELHPDFGVGPIRVFKAPYEVTRKGYGEFTVPVTITWKRHLKKPKSVHPHTLNFQGRITHTGFIVEFEPELLFQSTTKK